MTTMNLPFAGVLPLVLFLAKATLLLCAALGATLWLRNSTAGARHLIWLAALVGVLALPLLSRIPALRVGLLPYTLAPVAENVEVPPPVAAIPAVAPMEVSAADVAPPAPVVVSVPGNAVVVTPAAAPSDVQIVSDIPLFDGPSLARRVIATLAAVWAVVALVLVGWLLAGMYSVRRIVRGARELTSPDWTTPLCEVADRLDLEVPPRLVMSDRIEMAFACRALSPTVVLPAAAASWTDDRRRAVLFHELAHVKRHDLLGHMLGRLACALYWFHPLVWTAARQLRAESERACDDLVLSCGARASEYAQHLLEMVTSVRNHGAPVMALPMARKKEFEGRMLAILDPGIRRASPGRVQAAAVIATIGALSLTVAAVAPASARPSAPTPPTQGIPGAAPDIAVHVVSAGASRTAPVAKVVTSAPDSPVVQAARTHTDVSTSTSVATATVVSPATWSNATVSHAISDVATAAANGVIGALLGKQESATPRQDSARVQALIRILETDTDASVRRTAAWGLNDHQSVAARTALIKAARQDADWSVREMAAWALADYDGSSEVASALVDLLHDKNARVRATAAWAIGNVDERSSASALEAAMGDPETEVREAAIWAYGQLDQRTAPGALVKALSDPQPRIRRVAAWSLGEVNDKATANAIVKAFGSETDRDVRMAEIHALSEMGEASPEVLEVALKSTDPEIRRRAVGMLAGSGGSWPWPWPWPRPRPNP
jgi:beta-lactamase regulating signal transducer with metallopeptidase domain/HEAT repeat protein